MEYRILKFETDHCASKFRIQYRRWWQLKWHDIRIITRVGPEHASTSIDWHATIEDARAWILRRTIDIDSLESYQTTVVETHTL